MGSTANPVRRVAEGATELFAHPDGRAARPMVHVLNFFNGRGNRRVASALGLGPGDRVLEVGFGGGAAIPTTMEAVGRSGLLCGVDLSFEMARLANRFRTAGAGNRPVVACGNAERLPLRSGTFDGAYAMHSHLFWANPLAGIRELHRVVRSGGRVLLGMDARSGIKLVRRFGRGYEPAGPAAVSELLADAGFTDIGTHKLAGGVVVVIGTCATEATTLRT